MMFESRLLSRFVGASENQLQNLYGVNRVVFDLLFGWHALKRARGRLLERLSDPLDAINRLSALATLSAGGKNKKFVYYNGKVYLDCFAPSWPGPAFDRMYDALVGNLDAPGEAWRPYIPSLVISITKKCVYRCEHCYAVQTLGKTDVLSFDDLLKIVKDFQKIGIGVVAWEGGEPLMRFEELLALIRATRGESEAMLATTGWGLTVEKARRLREAGLDMAIISLDHYEPDKHNAFRGNKRAFEMAVNAVRIFRENGILPSIALCATQELMDEGGLWRYLELAKEVGAAFIQILDATPSGNYIGKDVMLTDVQLRAINDFHLTVNTDPRYRDYPTVQARALIEGDELYGCGACNALVYVDSSGNVQACDLLQVSFGNLLEEDAQTLYDRMKQCFPQPTRGRCPAQLYHKQVEGAYKDHGSLPIPHEKCADLLKLIGERELPDAFREVRDKMQRRRFLDLL